MARARDKPHNVWGNPLIKSSFIFKVQQRKRERDSTFTTEVNTLTFSRSKHRSSLITMRSVEDILLQLIPIIMLHLVL